MPQGGKAWAGVSLVKTGLRLEEESTVLKSWQVLPNGQQLWHGQPEAAVKEAPLQIKTRL